MENLTYIYQKGRLERLKNKEHSSKEFFYGFFELKNKFSKSQIIEFHDDFRNNLSFFINSFLRKLSGLPFFSEYINSKKNKKIIKTSDVIICTNQRVGYSIIFKILFSKNITTVVFIMGLYNQKIKHPLKKFFRNFFIYFFTKTFDKLIFLSLGEYEYAKNNLSKFNQKMFFLPFSTDEEFWSTKNEKKVHSNPKQILFIGNDGKRDYKFIIDLARELKDYNFVLITKKINPEHELPTNIKLLDGKWDDMKISDSDIKTYYEESHVTLIPLIQSLQPSGQSVALQSMSMGTPVIITKTDGFWEPDKFKEDKHIIFAEKNDIITWKRKIDYLLSNEDFYFKLSREGRKLILNNNTLGIFNKRLEEIIFNS